MTISETSEIFKALGDENRLKLLKVINSKGNHLCVGALARETELSQPAVSQHLKVLKNSGLVKAEKDGQQVHYDLSAEKAEELGINLFEVISSLEDNAVPKGCCCGGQSESECCTSSEKPDCDCC